MLSKSWSLSEFLIFQHLILTRTSFAFMTIKRSCGCCPMIWFLFHFIILIKRGIVTPDVETWIKLDKCPCKGHHVDVSCLKYKQHDQQHRYFPGNQYGPLRRRWWLEDRRWRRHDNDMLTTTTVVNGNGNKDYDYWRRAINQCISLWVVWWKLWRLCCCWWGWGWYWFTNDDPGNDDDDEADKIRQRLCMKFI